MIDSKLNRCKGEKCKAIGGIGHSDECEREHSSVVDRTHTKPLPPKCFDRAESGGRVFDNCR